MKHLVKPKSIFSGIIVIVVLSFTTVLLASTGGKSGRTLKSSTSGCSCHSSSLSAAVAVVISGPDTLNPTMQGTYTVRITGGPMVSGGIDIASSVGTLAIVTSDLKTSSGELVHSSPKLASSGAVTFQFKFTPSSTLGDEIIYATGISCNNTGGSGGDQWNFAVNKTVHVVSVSSVSDISLKPGNYLLNQNYPNPFNPNTIISYSLPNASNVKISVYNALGETVQILEDGFKGAGNYSVSFNASNMPSGIYFYRIEADKFFQVKKMMLLK